MADSLDIDIMKLPAFLGGKGDDAECCSAEPVPRGFGARIPSYEPEIQQEE